MNTVILVGRLAADPEVRTTQNGKAVATFRLAVNRPRTKEGKQEADFFQIVAWNQLGELCGKYLAKGRECAVVGRLQNRSYDAQDGSKRFVTEVIADEVQFLGGRGSGEAQPQEKPAPQGKAQFAEIEEDKLPF